LIIAWITDLVRSFESKNPKVLPDYGHAQNDPPNQVLAD